MARRFTRAVRVAEMCGAALVVAVLAILFLPRLTGGGNAARDQSSYFESRQWRYQCQRGSELDGHP